MTSEMKTRAVLYLRISADPNKTEQGVDAQRADCLALAEREGFTVVGEYTDDDRSAFKDKPRPDFERLLGDMTMHMFDVVIVWVSDRLYRKSHDLSRITDILQTYPVRIAQVKGGEIDLTTADGILRAQMLGNVAEFESRRKSERVALRAEHRAKAEGRMTASRLITGWRWREPCPGGDACRHGNRCPRAGLRPVPGSRAGIEPDPVEGPLLAKAYQMIADGQSLNACARLFNESGVPARHTDHWRAPTIRRALVSPRNAGLVGYRGDVVGEAADGLRIVSVELFQRVRTILGDEKRKTAGRPAGTVFSAIATCGKCGGPMNASRKMNAPVYICSRNQHLTRRRHLVDEPALRVIRDWIVEHAAVLADYVEPEAGPAQRHAADEVATLTDRLAALSELAASGELDPADYAATARTIREKLADAQRRAVVASGRPGVAKLLQADDPGAEFDRMTKDDDVEPLRVLLRELLDAVVIVPGKTGLDGLDVQWRAWAVSAATQTAAS